MALVAVCMGTSGSSGSGGSTFVLNRDGAVCAAVFDETPAEGDTELSNLSCSRGGTGTATVVYAGDASPERVVYAVNGEGGGTITPDPRMRETVTGKDIASLAGSHASRASRRRLPAIDIARTAALGGMSVFHGAWDLTLFGALPPGATQAPGWWIFARLIAGSFLFLSGMALWRAHGDGIRWPAFLRRLSVLVLAAAAISLAGRVPAGPPNGACVQLPPARRPEIIRFHRAVARMARAAQAGDLPAAPTSAFRTAVSRQTDRDVMTAGSINPTNARTPHGWRPISRLQCGAA